MKPHNPLLCTCGGAHALARGVLLTDLLGGEGPHLGQYDSARSRPGGLVKRIAGGEPTRVLAVPARAGRAGLPPQDTTIAEGG